MTLPTRFDPTPPRLTGPRLMRQFWADISFVHWAVDPARVAPLLPAGTRPTSSTATRSWG